MFNAADLAKMKKDELVALCKQQSISGYSRLKKDELIALLSETGSEGTQPAAGETAAASGKKKAPAKKKSCTKTKAAKTPNSELTRYCTALVNLWGLAPAVIVAAVYNQFQNASVENADVEAAAACPVVNSVLVHPSLADDKEAMAALLKKQSQYTHYIPSPAHIEDYLDENYREKTDEFAAMCNFMVRTCGMDEEIARSNTNRILRYLDNQSDISRLMGELAGSGMRFENDQQFRSFAVLLNKMKSTSRFWGFCGHTPEEAENFAQKRGPVHVYKVGRNDLCPCGSGKKYKKCCGR